MFTAMGLMFLGVALGFALRGGCWPARLARLVSPVIMLMLFALGVSVGGNALLMANLPVLGGKALVLTLAGVAGSLLAVACIRRYFGGPSRLPSDPEGVPGA